MRKATAIILSGAMLLLSSVLHAAMPPTLFFFSSETEIHGYADMNGNGSLDAVLIDRATGTVRIGFASGGSPTWSAPRPVGFYGVTGATAGLFLNTAEGRHSLALSAPLENSFTFFSQSSVGAEPSLRRVTSSLAGFGIHSLAAAQLSGTETPEDLMTLSNRNLSPINRANLASVNTAGNISGSQSSIYFSSTGAVSYGSAQRVMMRSDSQNHVGFMVLSGATATLHVVAMGEATQPIIASVHGLNLATEYILHPFSGQMGELITWVKGTNQYQVRMVSQSGSTFSFGAPQTVSVPFSIGYAASVPADFNAWLLLISEDGTQALLHQEPTVIGGQILTPPAGQFFTGVIPMPNGFGQFQLLSGAEPFGRSLTNGVYAYDGSEGFYLDDMDGIPAISPVSGAANVLVFDGEPFVNPLARVLRRWRVSNWTSQPVLGANVQVTAESYNLPAKGLSDPAVFTAGTTPPGGTHVLVNQFDPAISVFALSPAQGNAVNPIEISPTPGVYSSAVLVSTTVSQNGWTTRYRTRPDEDWKLYVDPFWIHQTSTVEVFANFATLGQTAISTATYTITVPPGELSTMGDGVPDYVKIGTGRDPSQLPDREGEVNDEGSYNYLQILLEGSGIDPRILSGAALRVLMFPRGHDGIANPSAIALGRNLNLPDGSSHAGVRIDVRDISGEIIDSGVGVGLPAFGVNQAVVVLDSLGVAGRSQLLVAATSPNFALSAAPAFDAGSPLVGREVVGILRVPDAAIPPYVHTYTGGPDDVEANNWIEGAKLHYQAQSIPTASMTLNGLETTALLLFEQWVTQRFVSRGLLPVAYLAHGTGSELPVRHLTLTPFRAGETAQPLAEDGVNTGPVFATPEQLQALSQYRNAADTGYDLNAVSAQLRQSFISSDDPRVVALRDLTHEVYRISARWAGVFPGAFPSPVDALRLFLHTGSLPTGYTNNWPDGLPAAIGASITSFSAADYSLAHQGMAALLSTTLPRPFVTWNLHVLPCSASHLCTVLERVDTGALVALVDSDGNRFRLPGSFSLIPGSVLRVSGYTDASPQACAPHILEVASAGELFLAELTSIPLPQSTDSDNNLLPDEWEWLFFSSTGNDPWLSPGNDGYSLFQIFLSGGDPLIPSSYSMLPPLLTSPPAVQIQQANPSQFSLSWDFPAKFAPFVQFSLQYSNNLSSDWTTLPATVNYLGQDRFSLLAPEAPPSHTARFWRVALGIR